MHTVNCGFRRQYGHLSTIDKRPVRQRLRIGVGRNDALILIRNRYTQWPLVKCFLKTTSIHCIYTVLKPWLHHQKPTIIFKVSSTGQSCRCRFIYWTEYYAPGMPECVELDIIKVCIEQYKMIFVSMLENKSSASTHLMQRELKQVAFKMYFLWF